MITVGSLFAGIGGIELGLEWTGGFKTLWQVEIDDYAIKVLEKRWPDVKRYKDVKDCGKHNLEYVDLICGGFPCQDISNAGKRVGIEGERSGLWVEFSRIIREIRPRYVLVENVSALLGRGLGRVLGDLAESGYDAEWDCLPASAFGTPHRRDRVFLVAYSVCQGTRLEEYQGSGQGREGTHTSQPEILRSGYRPFSAKGINPSCKDVADTNGGKSPQSQKGNTVGLARKASIFTELGRQPTALHNRGCNNLQPDTREIPNAQRSRLHKGYIPEARSLARYCEQFQNWWTVEPNVGRVAHGIPARVDRLKCLGNAVVPQIAYWIGLRILEREREKIPF